MSPMIGGGKSTPIQSGGKLTQKMEISKMKFLILFLIISPFLMSCSSDREEKNVKSVNFFGGIQLDALVKNYAFSKIKIDFSNDPEWLQFTTEFKEQLTRVTSEEYDFLMLVTLVYGHSVSMNILNGINDESIKRESIDSNVYFLNIHFETPKEYNYFLFGLTGFVKAYKRYLDNPYRPIIR